MPFRIAIHDFVGHPFQVELSRELARRGHDVLHLYCPDFEGPKGALRRGASDPVGFNILPVRIRGQYRKYSLVQRMIRERRYATDCVSEVVGFAPDVVLSGNALPQLQNWIRVPLQRLRIPFVAWIQDIYGLGIGVVLARMFGPVGHLMAFPFRVAERRLVSQSNASIFICEEFMEFFQGDCSRSPGKAWHVVGNWAALGRLPVRPKDNPWCLAAGLAAKRVVLYSGILGLKHNPELLVQLALSFRERRNVIVVVITEGPGRAHLERRQVELGLQNLRLLDFQPFELFPDVMGTGDVLLAMLGKEAGRYAVPSKVLTYLCARRAILLSMPRSNLAARTVIDNDLGIVVEPDDEAGFIREAWRLLDEPAVASAMADRARRYAESAFDISLIGSRFEEILSEVIQSSRH